MKNINSNYISIEQAAGSLLNIDKKQNTNKANSSNDVFKDYLSNSINKKSEVEFSKHANHRLMDRNINLSSDQIERLNNGVDIAREKSINESLVLMDNLAFIVNIKNNTVITAVDSKDIKNNAFTNIDGAVII